MLPTLGALTPKDGHSIQQCFDPVADFLALAIEQAQLRQQQERMLADRVGAAGGQRQRRRRDHLPHLLSRPAADSIFREQRLQASDRELRATLRDRRQFQQRPDPGFVGRGDSTAAVADSTAAATDGVD